MEMSQASNSMLHMNVNGELAALFDDKYNDMVKCSRLANCRATCVLVVALYRDSGVITLFDALTSQVISHSLPLDGSLTYAVAASRTADGRGLVIRGHRDGMICARMADSGALVGQWRGISDGVNDVAIDMKAGW
jgi:hypothetical protein